MSSPLVVGRSRSRRATSVRGTEYQHVNSRWLHPAKLFTRVNGQSNLRTGIAPNSGLPRQAKSRPRLSQFVGHCARGTSVPNRAPARRGALPHTPSGPPATRWSNHRSRQGQRRTSRRVRRRVAIPLPESVAALGVEVRAASRAVDPGGSPSRAGWASARRLALGRSRRLRDPFGSLAVRRIVVSRLICAPPADPLVACFTKQEAPRRGRVRRRA
jgi:hypothetical protein